jgi:hypothetical protein
MNENDSTRPEDDPDEEERRRRCYDKFSDRSDPDSVRINRDGRVIDPRPGSPQSDTDADIAASVEST